MHFPITRHPRLALAAMLLGLLTSLPAVQAGEGGTATLEGRVYYRERIALPPNAVISVLLEDVARADAPAEVVASKRFGPEGGPPWRFTLGYDPDQLDPRGRHVVRARIEVEGRLWFTNTESIPAFDGEGTVQVLVRRVGAERDAATPRAERPLTGTRWLLVEIDGEPAAAGADGRPADFQLNDAGQAAGFGGCNRFSGGVKVEGDRLLFGPMMSTMMACSEGDQVEQAYLVKLVGSVRFSVSGDALVLYGGDDSRPVLRFCAE